MQTVVYNIQDYVRSLCEKAKASAAKLAVLKTEEKNRLLSAIADALEKEEERILAANREDLSLAEENGVKPTMLDRLRLTRERIQGMSEALRALCALPDPVGEGSCTRRPNGLSITRIQVPLGVVGIIYEARPNVTVDAAGLCIKSGNAAVLRGGKEAIATNRALVDIIRREAISLGFPEDTVSLVDNTERASAEALMNMRGLLDVLIPRGGKGLIQNVVQNAKVPVIETGAGNCHLFVDASADIPTAIRVAINAKASRPSVCNAVETLLCHEEIAREFLPAFQKECNAHGVSLRGCPATCQILSGIGEATDEDYATEYNDLILAVRVVPDLDEAIAHIRKYSTGHSEGILTQSMENADRFTSELDAAALYVNASTRFTDGGEFGLGAEIGISTQKLHARGPMGLSALTTEKYIVKGNGQIR